MKTLPRLSALLLGLAAGTAIAATHTGSLIVNANVASVCYVSGTTLDFGSGLDPIAGTVPVDTSATMTVRCTQTTPWTVSLDAGLNAGGPTVFAARRMVNAGHTLAYQLYTDAARTTIWGNGSGGTATTSGTGTGGTQSLTVYGRLPALSGAVPGTYADTVTVTVTY